MKKLRIIVVFIFICNFLYSQNTSYGSSSFIEDDLYIAEKWEMLTNAGFGYDLIFNNENKTFQLKSIGECTFPIKEVINGKFKISTVKNQMLVTLIFKDFTIDYYFKYPRNSACATSGDKITESENKYIIELDSKGYSRNYIMIIKEVKIINKKNTWPQYYTDLISHCFEYSVKNEFVDDVKEPNLKNKKIKPIITDKKEMMKNIPEEDRKEMEKALEEAEKGLR